MNARRSLVQRPFYYTTLGADPTNADVVYAGAEGFFKSTDGGRTFASMRTPHGDNHDIWINPKDGNTMIQSNDGGANVSFDGGRTWSTQMNQPTVGDLRRLARQAVSLQALRRAAGQHDAHHLEPGGSVRHRGDSALARAARPGPIMPHPTDPDIVYGNCKGQYSVDEPRDGPGEELLGRRPVALRQPGERSDLALPARVADGDVAARSGHPLLRVAARAPHARQGRDVGDDLARPDGKARGHARAPAASRSRATSRARSSTARCTRSPNRRSSAA